ncbi:cytochrome P450 [Brevibacillus laterosporus]|uniref:cytochrome P450 n=1 Tax=Brevibacillus laterosporus TaxID=1465 RepID=UPI00215D22C0|nr:cytochrome P450 [Brevibacillus laterosporus]MCR8993782.1 cytochrome P450 [Brevibacillus laterosporus]
MKEVGYIPQPKTYGPLGNYPLIDKDTPTLSLCKLAEEFGPIYRLTLSGSSSLVISGHKLAAEVCDESRFFKNITGDLENVRAFSGDGLFTSRIEEPNWQKAHNILLPTFSQQAMKGYHSMMVDIALQLIQKWARLNPNESIDVPGDMTRLTLDTIGICGFNYRFNSFYRETHSPFINSMVRALQEAMHQSGRLKIQNTLMVGTRRQFTQDIETMFSLVDKIIEERKANGDQGEIDLLTRMLNGKDPQTGERLDDENIRYQIITFLIAGHETTSGLLSFALYFLLKNPKVREKAYQEVDRVLTGVSPSYQQVLQLTYVRMILQESLRLWPTAPGFELTAREDTIIGGKYAIKKGEVVALLLPQLHRDKDAWGDDADEFRPERFEDPDKVPHHAYKPFGNGQRACIGMQFALHEATLVLGMILQNFELIDHTNYQLSIQQTLTIKPEEFYIRVKQRKKQKLDQSSQEPEVGAVNIRGTDSRWEQIKTSIARVNHASLLILYGSNLGTAERTARELSTNAGSLGIRSEMAPLDDWLGKLPKEGVVLIVTASYNGKPPNNARKFVQWLEGVEAGALQGVTYAVFGCGDRNWANTYQDVPRFIDEQLTLKGAKRLSLRGEADTSGDFEKQLEDWQKRMWLDVMETFILQENLEEKDHGTLTIQFMNDLSDVPLALKYNAVYAYIKENQELESANCGRSIRQVEITLPDGLSYQEGDQIGVLPKNRKEHVERILQRFGLNGNDHLIMRADGRNIAHLPLDRPVRLDDLLSQNVDLQATVTHAQLHELAAYTVCPPHKRELEALLDEITYEQQVEKNGMSMLELLEKYEACEMPFERVIELLPPLQPKYYTITSSPENSPHQASIMIGADSLESECGVHLGMLDHYLADCRPEEKIIMFISTPES